MSLLTTGRDAGRLMVAMLDGGAYKGKRILRPESMAASQQPFYSAHGALGGTTLGGFSACLDGTSRPLLCSGADTARPAPLAFSVFVVPGLPHVVLIELRQAGPLFRTRITPCCAYREAGRPCFVPGLPHVVPIERQAGSLVSYQDYHMLCLSS